MTSMWLCSFRDTAESIVVKIPLEKIYQQQIKRTGIIQHGPTYDSSVCVRIFESFLLVPISMSWSHHLPHSQPCSPFLPIHPPISSHLPSIVPFPCPCPIYVPLSLPLSSCLQLFIHPCQPSKPRLILHARPIHNQNYHPRRLYM